MNSPQFAQKNLPEQCSSSVLFSRFRAASFLFLIALSPNAHAYLDPGTGSIILQGLIAGVAAVLAYFGLYWQKVKSIWARLTGKVPPTSQPKSDTAEEADENKDGK